MATTQWLQRDQTLPFSAKGVACKTMSQHTYQSKHVLLVGLKVSAVRKGHTFHPPPQPPASSVWKMYAEVEQNRVAILLQIPHHFCNNSADSLLLFLTSPSLSRGRTLNSNLFSAAIAHAKSAESIRRKKTDQNTAPEGLISSCSVSFHFYTYTAGSGLCSTSKTTHKHR